MTSQWVIINATWYYTPAMSDTETRWMIVAPAEFLARGARSARLNPNAVVVDHSEGELVFPSFFCRSPSPWMKAMAWLAMRNIEFRIYMLEFDLKPKEVERSRLGVYPRVSDDLLELCARLMPVKSIGWRLCMTRSTGRWPDFERLLWQRVRYIPMGLLWTTATRSGNRLRQC